MAQLQRWLTSGTKLLLTLLQPQGTAVLVHGDVGRQIKGQISTSRQYQPQQEGVLLSWGGAFQNTFLTSMGRRDTAKLMNRSRSAELQV